MQTRSRTLEMPSGLSLPLAFGMNTRLIGSGRYVSSLSASAQFGQPPLHPIRFDIRKVLTVCSRCTPIGAALGVGMRQDILTADLVVQGIEAIASLRLRFRV